MDQVAFTIQPLAPFRLDLTVWVLRRRPDNRLDRWDGATYRRVVMWRGRPVEIAVTQAGPADAPRLEVLARGPGAAPEARGELELLVRRTLGTDVDLSGFERLAGSDPILAPLAARMRGAKPTRYPTVFEGLVNAIACQQITLTFGLQILGRLVEGYGQALEIDGERHHAFPRPEDVLGADPERLKSIGFSRQKSRAMLELAEGLVEGTIDLDCLEAMDDVEALATLQRLRGVGRWTAEYVLLRALGRIHVFPGDDVGGRNNLRRYLKIEESLDYAGVQQALAAWDGYGGLLYFYFLLSGLAEKGYLNGAG